MTSSREGELIERDRKRLAKYTAALAYLDGGRINAPSAGAVLAKPPGTR